MNNKSVRSIILVGYRSSNGNLVPTFYFETQEQFDSWFKDKKISSGNLIFFKLFVPFFEDLDTTEKADITDYIIHPYI